MSKQLIFSDFTGGLNLNEATTIKDNEFSKADNVYYDNDNRLTTRKGTSNIFEPIPDDVTVVQSMNTFDGDGTWTASGDAGSVATETSNKKYDAGSVEFVITTSGTTASISNTGLTAVDLTTVKETGYFGFWIYLPAALTSVTLTLGDTLDSDDYEAVLTTRADGNSFAQGWNYAKVNWADMTSAGSPTGSIDEIRFTCTYPGGYAGGTVYVDGLVWYSGTSAVETHSLYHVKLDDGTRVTLAAAKESLFILEQDNDWVLLSTGYSDGLKFSFINYKSVIYFSNGEDNFAYYTPANESGAGSVVTADASAPKAKYLMIVANTAYAAGIKDSLNEVKYSNALPTDLTGAWPNNEFIYDDNSREVITGIGKLPSDAIIVFLENSAYYVDTVPTTSVIRPIDYDGGCQSFRTIQRVENDLFFLAEDHLYSLNQRQGTNDTFDAGSLSDNIQPKIVTGSDLTTANGFRGRNVKPNHYYLNLDTEQSGSPDSCLVLNIKLKAWTEYTGIAANQMTEYQDENDDWHLIYANVFSGQVREIETGFDDNGVEINSKVWTKENDFGDPTLYKEIRECDISGFISESAVINVTDKLDGEDNATDQILGTNYIDSVSGAAPLGTATLGVKPLTGSPIDSENLPLALFNVRKNVYLSAFRAQIKLESSSLYSQWVLSKIQFQVEALPTDWFPSDDYI